MSAESPRAAVGPLVPWEGRAGRPSRWSRGRGIFEAPMSARGRTAPMCSATTVGAPFRTPCGGSVLCSEKGSCSRRARARARARLTYGPPCSFPPLVRAHGAPGELGTHPEAAPGEAPNLAPSARNGRLPWELWREKVRRIRDYMLFTMHARAAHAGPTAAGLAMARYAGLSSSAAEPWGRVASTRVWPCRLSLRGRL